MKIYQVKFHHAQDGLKLSWHTSKTKADKDLHAQQREQGKLNSVGVEEVNEVDIPTTRAALVDWLNLNLKTDNG